MERSILYVLPINHYSSYEILTLTRLIALSVKSNSRTSATLFSACLQLLKTVGFDSVRKIDNIE